MSVHCRDECGASLADEEDAMQVGWTWLAVARGWRCPTCQRSCTAAGVIVGPEADGFVDTLPAGSRGALPKETASSIAAPAVKA